MTHNNNIYWTVACTVHIQVEDTPDKDQDEVTEQVEAEVEMLTGESEKEVVNTPDKLISIFYYNMYVVSF